MPSRSPYGRLAQALHTGACKAENRLIALNLPDCHRPNFAAVFFQPPLW
jgi:hypothetical protein